MINWIVGGIIIGLAVLIVVRMAKRVQSGENCCGDCCHCHSEHKC